MQLEEGEEGAGVGLGRGHAAAVPEQDDVVEGSRGRGAGDELRITSRRRERHAEIGRAERHDTLRVDELVADQVVVDEHLDARAVAIRSCGAYGSCDFRPRWVIQKGRNPIAAYMRIGVSFGSAPISTGPAPRSRASATQCTISAVAIRRWRKSGCVN